MSDIELVSSIESELIKSYEELSKKFASTLWIQKATSDLFMVIRKKKKGNSLKIFV